MKLSALAFGRWVPVRLDGSTLVFVGGAISPVVPVQVEWSGGTAERRQAKQLQAQLEALGCRDVRLVRAPTPTPECAP